MEMLEVLVARIVSGLTILESDSKIFFLRARFSETA
jgi:hypothetical protein